MTQEKKEINVQAHEVRLDEEGRVVISNPDLKQLVKSWEVKGFRAAQKDQDAVTVNLYHCIDMG